MYISEVKQRLVNRGKGGLFKSTAKLSDDHYDKYILQVVDHDKTILKLLNEIKKHSMNGHSFSVVVDPGEKGEAKFGIDGDGADKIIEIKHQKATKTHKIS